MFQPVLPLSGLAGWALLNRTMENQAEAFNASPRTVRDTDYFEARIGTVTRAEDLVADRRLLRVALGAFGLNDDIDNRFLIRKVLEGGVADPQSLANSLSDDRYRQLSEAFGFGSPVFGPRTGEPGFGAEITAKFRSRAFEIAVGEQDPSFRIALNAERELGRLAKDSASEDTRWYRLLGNPPLRQLFETALGLPQGFGQLDIERQLDDLKQLSRDRLGITSFDDLTDQALRDNVIRTYLLRDQVRAGSSQSPQAIALSLLQGAA